jgi:imidazolonepropionase-like amidohydrolase
MLIQTTLSIVLRHFLLPLFFIAFSTLTYSQDTLLKNGRLIIGDGAVIETGSVLIRDGLIAAVSADAISVGLNTKVIELSGKTIMPALIDAHAHLGFQSATSWGAENYSLENIVANLEQYAYYGFAAVLSAGTDPIDLALSIQDMQSQDQLGGARLLFAAGMGPPGQGPNDQFLTQIAAVEQRLNTQVLRGLNDTIGAINAARDIEELGVPFIKVWIDDRGGSQTKLHPDIYQPLIAEAQRLGIKTLVHQQSAEDMLAQIDAGAAGFLHGRLEQGFSREIAAAAGLNQVFIVPNLGLAQLRRLNIGRDRFLQPVISPALQQQLSQRPALSQPQQQELAQLEQRLNEAFTLLSEERVEVILGTDAGAIPNHPFGYTGHKELEIYTRLGFTPMQALIAGTSRAAKHLNLTDLGLIAEGYSADLLVLYANPLDSISNTQLIERVFLKGKQVDREAIAVKLQTP